MPREVRLTGEQMQMMVEIQALKTENAASGGKLFVAFGQGGREALVFPTHIVVEKDGNPVADELLVLTAAGGYKKIRFDRRVAGVSVQTIIEVITDRLTPRENRVAGYGGGILVLGDSVFISSKKLEDHIGLRSSEYPVNYVRSFFNCSLVDMPVQQKYVVNKFLEVNRKRAQVDHSTLQEAGKLPQ